MGLLYRAAGFQLRWIRCAVASASRLPSAVKAKSARPRNRSGKILST